MYVSYVLLNSLYDILDVSTGTGTGFIGAVWAHDQIQLVMMRRLLIFRRATSFPRGRWVREVQEG
jgi:hypothetical protein